VSHRLLLALAPDREVADRQCAAELHQPALAQKVGGFGLAHEVEDEVGRHCGGSRPQPSHEQQIEAEVGQPYQGRAGDGATRAQMLFLGGQAHADGGVVEMLDAEIDVGGLRGAPGPSR
jgi:hypothetical protein